MPESTRWEPLLELLLLALLGNRCPMGATGTLVRVAMLTPMGAMNTTFRTAGMPEFRLSWIWVKRSDNKLG